jgi:hypothetical protein
VIYHVKSIYSENSFSDNLSFYSCIVGQRSKIALEVFIFVTWRGGLVQFFRWFFKFMEFMIGQHYYINQTGNFPHHRPKFGNFIQTDNT